MIVAWHGTDFTYCHEIVVDVDPVLSVECSFDEIAKEIVFCVKIIVLAFVCAVIRRSPVNYVNASICIDRKCSFEYAIPLPFLNAKTDRFALVVSQSVTVIVALWWLQ